MRKKSHISLARYMVENLKDEELKHHKFSFYLGSILPDIKPSFLYKRHEMDGTFPYVSRHIMRLSEGDALIRKKKGGKYYRDLGQISHYLADYFTFPHNKTFDGTLRQHNSYEKHLKNELKAFVQEGKAEAYAEHVIHFETLNQLLEYIKVHHRRYMNCKRSVEEDIHYILSVCYQVFQGLFQLCMKDPMAEYATAVM